MKLYASLVALFLSVTSFAQISRSVSVSNKLEIERKDELVVLSRSFLERKLGSFTGDKYILVSINNRPKLVQLDDFNDDGNWDEAVFLHSFKAKETAVFKVQLSDRPAAIKASVLAHVRHQHKFPDDSFGPSVLMDTMPYNNKPTDFSKQKLPPYLTEGPAWENDKVGFRKYFDTRNTNDIWGKTTSRMVLDEVGVDPSKIYHDFDSTWGMDILKVGKSLGAGALALQLKTNDGTDTIARLGTNVLQEIYERVADGPVRAIFRIKYKGWQIAQLPALNVEEQISIWGGQYFFENKVTITNTPIPMRIVTGIPDFYHADSGTISIKGAKAIYNFGIQSENKDKLGLAVATTQQHAPIFARTPDAGQEVLNTYTVSMTAKPTLPINYRFYSGWQQSDERFASKELFESYMMNEVKKLASPLMIK
jgi:hypothetical protein